MRRSIVEGEPVPVNLPSLRVALDQWLASGYVDESLLKARAELLSGAQIPARVLAYAYGFSREFGGRVAILRHEATISAAAKQRILIRETAAIRDQTGSDEIPLPVKTVTLAFHTAPPLYVLVTGIGDFRIDRQMKRKIAWELDLSNSFAKHAEINPPDVDPQLLVGLPQGIVGPFVHPGSSALSGIFYFGESLNASDGLVALAATPWETLVVNKSAFHLAVNDWHNRNARRVFFRPINAAA